LKQLQPLFDTFVVDVDGTFQPSSAEGRKTLQGFLVKINEINKQISQIRTEIIS
jgi:hypothetical protein